MANRAAQITVATTGQTLLWQTSTGVAPDTAINPAAQVFRAGNGVDSVPILIVNHDGTNAVFLGGSAVTIATGARLAAGGSLTFNVIGNDSLFAQASTAAVVVGVSVGRQ
jgi:hypothetical protein